MTRSVRKSSGIVGKAAAALVLPRSGSLASHQGWFSSTVERWAAPCSLSALGGDVTPPGSASVPGADHDVDHTGGIGNPAPSVFTWTGRGRETRGAALIAGSARGCEHAPEHTTGIEVKVDPHERAHDGIAHDRVDLEIAGRVFVNA
jgi:hypothetical protein